MVGLTPPGPTLDRSGTVWRGEFPGLGTVEVDPDGAVRVEVWPPLAASDGLDVDTAAADADEAEDVRARALRVAWGEPLSLVRRGFSLVAGAGLVDPVSGAALVCRGTPHDVGLALLPLGDRGWSVLTDRLLPIRVEPDRVFAHPRTAPVLLARRRARRRGLAGEPARADTDAVIVDVPRATEPAVVCAVVEVSVRRPGGRVLEPLVGHQRFEAAATVVVGGALAEDIGATEGPAVQMARHLRISRLSFARWCVDDDTIEADVDELLGWFAGLDADTDGAQAVRS